MGWFWGDDERLLTGNEGRLIRRIFKTTVLPPMGRIRIRNGLSPSNTPITTPRTDKRMVGFKVSSRDDFLIMVGQYLFDRDVALEEPGTLIHEMVHVWQFMHGTISQAGALAAHAKFKAADKLIPGVDYEDLYSYEVGESWINMGFEGQAQMVEEWFLANPGATEKDEHAREWDNRWPYVKRILYENDRSARGLPLDALLSKVETPNLELPGSKPASNSSTVAFEKVVFSDDYLLSLLGQAIGPYDVKAMAARVAELESYCRQYRKLEQKNAIALAGRFVAKKSGDAVAQAFHYRLSTPTRGKLLNILWGLA